MDEIVLGPARVSEAPQFAEMSRELIEHGLRWRWQAKAIARQVRSHDTEVLGFGAMTSRQEVGHIIPWRCSRRIGWAGSAGACWPIWRPMAATAGMSEIRLEVRTRNHGARHFYEALGYREVALVRGYYDGRESAIRMSPGLKARG
jgi:ribosomal-protein-alanine N-acetyltransferase